MSTQARIDQARLLTGKLFQVVRRLEEEFDKTAADLGLTALPARTLLGLREPTAMRHLSEDMACDASNITGLADRLERLGLVERVPGRDRRVKLLTLTPRGCEIRGELESRLAAGSPMMAILTPTEREQLSRLLDKLSAG